MSRSDDTQGFVPVKVAFGVVGHGNMIVRHGDSLRIVQVFEESGVLLADLHSPPSMTFKELVALLAELGLENDHQFIPDEETGRQSDKGPLRASSDSPLRLALKELLGEQWNLKEWLVKVGGVQLPAHQRVWDSLLESYVDQCDCERKLLELTRKGSQLCPIAAGEKRLVYHAGTERWSFTGTLDWTFGELVLILVQVFADEDLNCDEFAAQWGPFLAEHRRRLLGEISPELADTISLFINGVVVDEGLVEAELPEELPAPSPDPEEITSDPVSQESTVTNQDGEDSQEAEPASLAESFEPTILLVQRAASAATVSPARQEQGFPAARTALEQMLASLRHT